MLVIVVREGFYIYGSFHVIQLTTIGVSVYVYSPWRGLEEMIPLTLVKLYLYFHY